MTPSQKRRLPQVFRPDKYGTSDGTGRKIQVMKDIIGGRRRNRVTIRITKPEVKDLIKRRLETGMFKDAEEVILEP
jgi:hypothetical protein